MKSCDILLATYNGEAFIAALLDSLLGQTCDHFRVIVRDDGSRDKTVSIIQDYEPRFAGRLTIVGDGVPSGSPSRNFELLMQVSTADHILFCDQDDVWLPNRVEVCLRLLEQAEADYGPEVPIFAFNDLIPVDRELKEITGSFWEFKKVHPEMGKSLSLSLVTSPMLGCASGINRSLLQLALPINPQASMHDWWTLHVAILFGKVVWSTEKTVLYRLHGGNSSQQTQVNLVDYARAKSPFARVRHGLRKKALHAEGLLLHYRDRMSPDVLSLFEDLVNIESKGYFERRLVLLKWKLVYPDMHRNVALFLGA